MVKSPDEHVILPGPIAKEAYAPAVRQGDLQWLSAVRWILFALIDAEDLGISKNNARELAAADTAPAVKRLLGAAGEIMASRSGSGKIGPFGRSSPPAIMARFSIAILECIAP